MNCPNTKCSNNIPINNADYCPVCGFAISDKAKYQQLQEENKRKIAERFRIKVAEANKDKEIERLKTSFADKEKEELKILPDKIFKHFEQETEKKKFTKLQEDFLSKDYNEKKEIAKKEKTKRKYNKRERFKENKKAIILIIVVCVISIAILVAIDLKINILEKI
jgi:hypothetical protein